MQATPVAKEFTAMALIVTATQPRKALLLESRKHHMWMPPGGHLKPGENPFEAVLREVREETQLDVRSYFPTPKRYDAQRVDVPLPMRIVEIHLTHSGKTHFHIDFMYRVEVPGTLEVIFDKRETASSGWFTLAELKELQIPADLLPVLTEELSK